MSFKTAAQSGRVIPRYCPKCLIIRTVELLKPGFRSATVTVIATPEAVMRKSINRPFEEGHHALIIHDCSEVILKRRAYGV